MYVRYGRAAAALDEGRHKDRRKEGGREGREGARASLWWWRWRRSESRNILE